MDISRLKEAKKELKLTYDELSQISGVPVSTIYDIFRGVTTSPRIDTVQAIERALGLSEWSAEEKAPPMSDDEKELLSAFRTIPPEGKDAVLRLIRSYLP